MTRSATALDTVSLGDVLRLDRDPMKVDPARHYPNLGIYSFGRGLFAKQPIDGARTSATTLYRVRAGQFIYSRLFAFEGAFGAVPKEMHGSFVSNEYPTFEVDESRALVNYLRLVLCRRSVWEELAAVTVGMGHRRQRLRPEDFLAFEIELPPIEEQRASLAAVEAIDRAAQATSDELARLGVLVRSLQQALDERDFDARELGEFVTEIEAGKSPKCEDHRPRDGEWGVLKVSAIREGRFIASEAKELPVGIDPFVRSEVASGDVLVSRANTSELVGAVCRVGETPPRLLLSDKTLRLLVDQARIDTDYLVEALALPSVRRQIEDAATGSSASMKNISQDALRSLWIPVPSPDEQRALSLQLRAVRETASCAARELDACQQLRSSLIEELVAGERHVHS